ncbi:MAG: hypothetical protein IH600_18210 [Bacteroidetes bacterium]|nr:hypothetical protein [Bacteroidota bacterium]
MKRTLLLASFLLLTMSAAAQPNGDPLFTIGDHEVGVYLGLGGRLTSLFGEPAGTLDARGAFTIDRRWSIGLMGAAFEYDKSLHALVDDGSYRINAAYGGFFVERMFFLGEHVLLSISIATGYGEVSYRYDKEYRKDKIWTEETIDRTEFAFFEPSVGLQFNVGGGFWIGMTGSYRNTSPVELLGTSEHVFQKFSGGLTITYALF